MSPGVPRCSQVSPGVPRCPQVSPGVPRCHQVSPGVPRCPQVSPDVPRCPQVSPGVPRCPQVSPDIPRCCRCPQVLQMSPDVPKPSCMHMLHTSTLTVKPIHPLSSSQKRAGCRRQTTQYTTTERSLHLLSYNYCNCHNYYYDIQNTSRLLATN